MNTVASWIKYLRIRRPFSRKIHLRTDHVLMESGSSEFLAEYGPLQRKFPLVAAIAALALAYRGDYDTCHALIEDIIKRGFKPELSRLYLKSDLRKFFLDCLRDYFENNTRMTQRTTDALFKLSMVSDDEAEKIFETPIGAKPATTPIRFDYVANGPKDLKIRIFCRNRFFGETSRPHDMGPRLKTAFAAVDCEVMDPGSDDAEIGKCDLALVDDVYIFRKEAKKRRRFLEKLRARAAKVGMLELDPWMPGFNDRVAQNRDLYDFIWTMAPILTEGEKIEGLPVCLIPFPVGCPKIFDRSATDPGDGSLDRLNFCGGIEEYNFHRYFWVLASSTFRSPFGFHITNHKNDGLTAFDSLEHYVRKLSSANASVNFTMRKDGRRTVVGRTFDCLRLGQLLVQEYCEDMHRYFTPGTHYLEFQNVSELEGICDEIMGAGGFERVRSEGAAYFSEFYSDEAVLRHLCTYL